MDPARNQGKGHVQPWNRWPLENGGHDTCPFSKRVGAGGRGTEHLAPPPPPGLHLTGQKVLDPLPFANELASLGLRGVDHESENSLLSR